MLWLWFTVLARRSVQTLVGEAQTLDRLAADDVRLDDFVDIGLGDMAVPDGVGIDHDVGPVLTLIEAAGLVGAHATFESTLGQLLLEEFLQPGFGERIAASARMACRALVPADEDMLFELRHQATVAAFSSSAVAISASQIPSKSTKYPWT